MVSHKRAARKARPTRRAPSVDPYASSLRLRSVGAAISPSAALDGPLLMNLVLEDVCWEFGRLALAAQRPPWWHLRQRREWRRDRHRLEAKRVRLLETLAGDALTTGQGRQAT